MMKTIEATTQFCCSNQHLQMIQFHKSFHYIRTHQNEDDAINNFFPSVWSHDGNTAIELIVGTRILLMDVYDIVSKSGLNIARFIQDCFCKCVIPINILFENSKEAFMGRVRNILCTYGLGSKQPKSHKHIQNPS